MFVASAVERDEFFFYYILIALKYLVGPLDAIVPSTLLLTILRFSKHAKRR